ncbi:uncharacterized protein RBU33_001093 isoform 1-T1 [Hipposideros larvatus]
MKQGAKKNLAGQRKEERDVWSHGNEIHTLPAGSLLPLPGETGLKESAETEKTCLWKRLRKASKLGFLTSASHCNHMQFPSNETKFTGNSNLPWCTLFCTVH